MITCVSKKVIKIISNHHFKLVPVPYPIPVIILKDIISIFPPSDRSGAMKVAGVAIPKLQPLTSRFLKPEHLLLEKHLLILMPSLSLLGFQGI